VINRKVICIDAVVITHGKPPKKNYKKELQKRTT
jgi:hypothetical protein